MNAPQVALHLRITGIVQGVGFRYTMQRKARSLGLSGWVRNCRDGSVEAVAAGPVENVEALVAWARHGPSSALVEAVRTETWTGDSPAGEFEQCPTV